MSSSDPSSSYLSSVWRDNIFANKVLFCTGGSGTICSAQVKALVRLGANACIVGRNAEKAERVAREIVDACSGRPGPKPKVLGLGGVDVRRYQDLENAVERCVGELGGVDYVIAGAAGNFLAPISQLSPNAYKAVIDIDVLGSYNTAKATLPHLVRSAERSKDGSGTGGRILFVSATMHYLGIPLQSHVSSAKAAVDALSTSIALEYGPRGITSNVIAPGPIANTEGMERLSQPSQRAAFEKTVPIGRLGSVRDIADASVYLFGPTGGYCNGSIMVVDGGAWRTSPLAMGVEYPDFLLSDDEVSGVKGAKQSKL